MITNCDMCGKLVQVTPSRAKHENSFCSDKCYKKHKSLNPKSITPNREKNLGSLLRAVGYCVNYKMKEIIIDKEDFETAQQHGIDTRITTLQWNYQYKLKLR